MFERKKNGLYNGRNVPGPIQIPEPPEPIPKAAHTCPLTRETCREACAWRVEGECAATFLAREMYTLVDVLARSLPADADDGN